MSADRAVTPASAHATVVRGIGELVTNAGPDEGPADERLAIVTDGAVAVAGDRIAWAGREADLPARFRDAGEVLDAAGRAVLPGFVDAHTHLVFAGDRADEFAARLAGQRYEDVLAGGGGINATVRATRAADRDELLAGARARLERMHAAGTTTAEVKSGYGLDVATERRMLEVVHALDASTPVALVPTWLGAHAVPPEFDGDREGFLDLLVEESLPACAPLARYADVFCDEGAFSPEEARRVLLAARDAGLGLRLHADELAHSGGARLAAELGAVSADHLAHADRDDAAALAAAGAAAVLLPATTFCLRTHHYAPARLLWDAGVTVALGTDCNPGTSYVESMPFVVALAVVEMGLGPAEATWAATRGGALALELADRGRIASGARADLMVLDAPSHTHLAYRPAAPLVEATIVGGRLTTAPSNAPGPGRWI